MRVETLVFIFYHKVRQYFVVENKIFFELKSEEYRDGIKRKGDKIGMRYKALHIIMELLTVQCLQVNEVIPILSPM